MYKLGINYTKSASLSYEEALPLFKSLGFDCVFSSSEIDGADTVAVAENAAKCGIFFESIHASWKGINNIWSENTDGDETEKRLMRALEECKSFGVPIAVMHLSSGENAPCVSDAGRRRFDRIVDTAVKNGTVIAFENQRKLANIAFVMELYDKVENVRFCWDVGHEGCFTPGKEFMPLFGEKLCYTHIHDNLCEYNGDLHRIPFDGCLDYERVARHIAKSGYSGTLTLETMPVDEIYKGVSAYEFYSKAYCAAVKFRDMCIKEAGEKG